MYQEYWGLKEMPFENTPDPRFLYYSTQHEEAFSRLLYAIKGHKGAAMLTGVFGCGKTILGRALFNELSKGSYKTVMITNPQLTYQEFLRTIAKHLGSTKLPERKSDLLTDFLLDEINEILTNNMRDGKDTVIIVDEAHIIKDTEVFEELRLLLNFQLEDKFLLTLILMGQPELKDKIDNIKQLKQRIAVQYHLGQLSYEDTVSYIRHRLEVAGNTGEIFTEKVLKLIHEQSGGIPRRINQICDLSLFSGFDQKIEVINAKIVSDVIKEMEF